MKQTLSDKAWQEHVRQQHVPKAVLNQLVLEYLITQGHRAAAETFCRESSSSSSGSALHLPAIDDRMQILQAVAGGRAAFAITRMQSAFPGVLQSSPDLLFALERLHLLEQIEAGYIEEALDYATASLSELAQRDPALLQHLESALLSIAVRGDQHITLNLQSERDAVLGHMNRVIMKESAPLAASSSSTSITPLTLSEAMKALAEAQAKTSSAVAFPTVEGLLQV